MRHENFSIKLGLFDEVRQASTMVDMKVCDKQQFNLFRIDAIKVWQLLHAFTSWVQTTVKHNFTALALEVDAAATDFTSRA